MDICFIKTQDMLALSIAICAWRFAKEKRLSRSEILEGYSAYRQEGRKHRQKMEPDRGPAIHQHA
jgi:hypothetical protein